MAPCNAGRRVVGVRPDRPLVHVECLRVQAGPDPQVAHLEVRQGVAGVDPDRLPAALLGLGVPAELCKRVTLAGVHPRSPAPLVAQQVAYGDRRFVRRARIGAPAGRGHGPPLDQQVCHHVLRARLEDRMHEHLDCLVQGGLVELHNAHRVRERVPCAEQQVEPVPVPFEKLRQRLCAAHLGHLLDRRGALKAAVGRKVRGRAQGHCGVEALDGLDDERSQPAGLFVHLELEHETKKLLQDRHGLRGHADPGQLVPGPDVGLDHAHPDEHAEHALRDQGARERIPALSSGHGRGCPRPLFTVIERDICMDPPRRDATPPRHAARKGEPPAGAGAIRAAAARARRTPPRAGRWTTGSARPRSTPRPRRAPCTDARRPRGRRRRPASKGGAFSASGAGAPAGAADAPARPAPRPRSSACGQGGRILRPGGPRAATSRPAR